MDTTTPAERADTLTEPEQQLLGRLSLSPTRTVKSRAVAALAGASDADTRARLDTLVDAS